MIRLKFHSILFLLLLLVSDFSFGQIPVPNGRRLRDIMADKYTDGNLLIGATTGAWAFNYATGQIMDREFDYVTPENDFKQHQIHPDNTSWSWNIPDRWINHTSSNQQTLRIHGPIGPQCSNWAQADNRTAAELELNMRSFMKALCQKYNDTPNFEYLDVINEIVINGAWHKNKPGTGGWENPWFIIGQDTDADKTPLFIKYAFEIANEFAPNLELIINHHEDPSTYGSWNQIKRTVAYLRNMGLRVDGIGWQAHVDAGWEKKAEQVDALNDLIDWAFQNDLEFHVTEQSVYISSPSETEYQKQAETYKAILDIIIEKSINGKITWNTWHIDDGNGWNIDRFPSIFDTEYRPKPAYYALQLALEAKGDYTTQHNVTFQLKNKYTNEKIENVDVDFNNEMQISDVNGEVSFPTTAGFYSLVAEKRFMETLTVKNLSVYSDTIFTLLMDTTDTEYDVTFQVKDQLSNTVSSVEIEINSDKQTTNLGGSATFKLQPGTVLATFSKTDYFLSEKEYQINSDTTLFVELQKSHGTIKFTIKDGTQPINNALVVIGNDSLYTTALGICRFNSYSFNNSYTYTVEKEYYDVLSSEFILNADTTISLQATRNVANIEFNISADSNAVENAFVVLNSDTAWFNQQGKCKLYNVAKNETQIYQVFSDNYPELKDSVSITKDTTINVFLITGLSDNLLLKAALTVYPNPANNFIYFTATSEIEYLEILNLNGRLVKQIYLKSNGQRIDVSELENGYYFLKFQQENGAIPVVRRVIIQK